MCKRKSKHVYQNMTFLQEIRSHPKTNNLSRDTSIKQNSRIKPECFRLDFGWMTGLQIKAHSEAQGDITLKRKQTNQLSYKHLLRNGQFSCKQNMHTMDLSLMPFNLYKKMYPLSPNLRFKKIFAGQPVQYWPWHILWYWLDSTKDYCNNQWQRIL